jgi:predicted dehydrogenase
MDRLLIVFLLVWAVVAGENTGMAQTNLPDARFRLITLDPGHFHAALMQKSMSADIDPGVSVYAPAGDDLNEHLQRIKGFNTRPDQPTDWREKVYAGPDYFEKMLAEKPGNVVVLSGNNARKAEYILRSVRAGLNVLADKPMVIAPGEWPRLQEAFAAASSNHVLLYDIMTERFEITTILQRELSRRAAVFGELVKGTAEAPAIVMESVHYFSKTVAGAPLKRPAWAFDVRQQGEGIVDVSTHLVDLAQWEAFPGRALHPGDATVTGARRWNTAISRPQFKLVTGLDEFPGFLQNDVKNGVLQVCANGEFTWKLRDVFVKATVLWDFQPPPGGNDTYHSILRGTRCRLEIRQGAEDKFKPVLYVESNRATEDPALAAALQTAIGSLQAEYPGIGLRKEGSGWQVTIPEKYDVGHEAHFSQVIENYLKYLRAGRLPDWEVPNMLTKYATIMRAYEMSR